MQNNDVMDAWQVVSAICAIPVLWVLFKASLERKHREYQARRRAAIKAGTW